MRLIKRVLALPLTKLPCSAKVGFMIRCGMVRLDRPIHATSPSLESYLTQAEESFKKGLQRKVTGTFCLKGASSASHKLCLSPFYYSK